MITVGDRPSISARSPVASATNVATTTAVNIDYNHPMQAGSGNVVVTRQNDNTQQSIAAASLTYSTNRVTIPMTLLGTSSYIVSVPLSVVRNLAGVFHASTSWSFITAGIIVLLCCCVVVLLCCCVVVLLSCCVIV